MNEIGMAYKKLRDFEHKTGIKSPSSTRSIIGSLFISLATEKEWKNIEEVTKCFDEALKVYNEALGLESFSKGRNTTKNRKYLLRSFSIYRAD